MSLRTVTLNGQTYQLFDLNELQHRCGKTTTSMVLRRPDVEISILAEGTCDAVLEKLGATREE